MRFSKKKDDTIECIRKRITLGEVWISVDRILMDNNMQFYASLCKRRIHTHAHMIQDEENIMDGSNGDLFLTEKGFVNQMPILSGYVNEKRLNDLLAGMRFQNKLNETTNELINALRTAKRRELLEAYDRLTTYGVHYSAARVWIREELKARSLFGRIRTLCIKTFCI